MPMERPQREEREAPMPGAAEFAGVGLQFAGAILLFLFAGRWLDERLGTSPWLLIVGVFAGAGSGFYVLYRRLVTIPRARKKSGEGE